MEEEVDGREKGERGERGREGGNVGEGEVEALHNIFTLYEIPLYMYMYKCTYM